MPILRAKTGGSSTGTNNGIKDPFQGFDCTLWMLDATGNLVNKGFFTSVQFTFRNATEPYMEMAQRVPRYLDGDFQIGWVAQRGMLDLHTLTETMGFPAVTRNARVSRSPRFTLVFFINAPELIEASSTGMTNGLAAYNPGAATPTNPNNLLAGTNVNIRNERTAKGKIVLLNCKLDTFAMGVQSGQRVVANQWEGLAEGYEVITTDLDNETNSINKTIGKFGNASDQIGTASKPLDYFYTK